jgi:glycerol kinase
LSCRSRQQLIKPASIETITADSGVGLKTSSPMWTVEVLITCGTVSRPIFNVPVVKPAVMETTAIGAAFAAGLAVGVWKEPGRRV